MSDVCESADGGLFCIRCNATMEDDDGPIEECFACLFNDAQQAEVERVAQLEQRIRNLEVERVEMMRVLKKLYEDLDREQIHLLPDGPCLICGEADSTDMERVDHATDCEYAAARRIVAALDGKKPA